MSHPPLPKDCYDVETVSHLLSISVVELYKFLREKDWLHNKAFKNDKRHNLPKDWTKKTGYLTTQERGFKAPYNQKIEQRYWVAIFTRSGLQAIAKMMNKEIDLPAPIPLTLENAQKIQTQQPNTRGNEEREKCIRDLAAMGIPINKASGEN